MTSVICVFLLSDNRSGGILFLRTFLVLYYVNFSYFILHVWPFFIIDWFTDSPTLFFGQTKKIIKLKISVLLFPPILKFILLMDWNIKNNKNSALVPQYTHIFL